MFNLIGKTLIDFSKLIFASIVLGSILSSGFNVTLLIYLGLLGCLIVLFLGVFLVVNNNIKKEEEE